MEGATGVDMEVVMVEDMEVVMVVATEVVTVAMEVDMEGTDTTVATMATD